MAAQIRLDLTQAANAEQLSEHQRDQMRLRLERSRVESGFVLCLFGMIALGYVAYEEAPDEWDELGPTGEIVRYHTTCTLMRKLLT